MSKFAAENINSIEPYTPGEQPQDRTYVKLNTNENPFLPSEKAIESVTREVIGNLRRYNDPTARRATQAVAKTLGLDEENVLLTNGSDEALAFAFMCYGKAGMVFPDVTYSFYKNLAALFNVSYRQIPLKEDYSIDVNDYKNSGKTVVIANPNAQTGIALSLEELELIIASNKNNVVIVDQAYADFSECDAIPLLKKYDNLLVIGTFSKSRALAGARIGYAAASGELISDLNKVKFSFNPYNVNSVSQIIAENSVRDVEYFEKRVNEVKTLRDNLSKKLKDIGFYVLPSSANFIATRHDKIKGQEIYARLKERGILVRHFSDERIANFVRITVGTKEENDNLISALKEIIEERK